MENLEKQTEDNTGMQLNICFNYGGRAEIVNATKKIAKKVKDGEIDIDDIDEKLFASNLYTVGTPDPDLLIRTSGELRTNGVETRSLIHDFKTPGIIQGLHNLDKSISSFARACFNFALDQKKDIWFATKDTISKKYDHRFKDIFNEIFETEYKDKFNEAGIEYFYTLIDDAVARVVRSEGGYIWACKNYDGDVMSDMVATAFGSLAMMTSVLVSPDGVYEYEAAHGTVQRHYYKHLKGEKTSTNSMATLFAWTGALRKRGELDNLPELIDFADKLEKASIETIEDGVMTGDLAALSSLDNITKVDTETFLTEIAKRLDKKMA